MSKDELYDEAKNLGVPYELLLEVHENGQTACRQLRCRRCGNSCRCSADDASWLLTVYLSVPVFSNPTTLRNFARAIVEATTHYTDYKLIAEVSKNLGAPMKGIEISKLDCRQNVCRTAAVVEAGDRRSDMMKIWVLALQGAVAEHIRSIEPAGGGRCRD